MLLAAADTADPDHRACVEAIQTTGPLVTTALVVAETAYLIGRQLGPAADSGRIAELIETYADLGLAAPTPASSSSRNA